MIIPSDIVIYSFLFIVFLAFVSLLFGKDSEDRKLQKIIGGLSVFVIAIIANKQWVFIISLFIGGLIIASENFMMFLAAIMKARPDSIAETVKALNATKASKEEIADKIKQEDFSLKTEQSTPSEPKKSANEYVTERLAKIKKIEGLVHAFLKNKYNSNYEIQMKLISGKGAIIVDGLVRCNGRIKEVVEIKFITEKSFSNLKYIVSRFLKKFNKLGTKIRVVVAVVSEQITLESAMEMNKYVEKNVSFIFFKYVDNKIEPILIPAEF